MPAIESIFETAKRVDYLNTSSHEGQISLTPRGDFIYFASNREGDMVASIYIALESSMVSSVTLKILVHQ